LSPNSTTGHFAEGYVAAAGSRHREARARYRQVLAIDPQHAAAINNIALLDLAQGRWTRSGRGFARAVATDPTLGLARRNVGKNIFTQTFAYHALAWLLYFFYSGVVANQETGSLRWTWNRGPVTCSLALVYVALAVFAYRRMDPNVRGLAKRMLIRSWRLKAVVLLDVGTLVCFGVSAFGQGTAVGNFYVWGIVLIGVAVTILFVAAGRDFVESS
jgi:hypothetical protein